MLQQNLVGEILQGHYQVISQLGGGGFGDTFLAIDTSKFNRQCVVKRLKPQNQSTMQWVEQAFEREARMLEALGRPEKRNEINQKNNLLQVTRNSGVLVLSVNANSTALRSGVKPGDVILSINENVY